MSASGRPPPGLAGLGVGPVHERVYRYLVRAGEARTVTEIAAELALVPRVSGVVLRALERQALVTPTSTFTRCRSK